MHHKEQVCIVGRGILSSGIESVSDFIEKLQEGKSLVEDLTKKDRESLPFDFSLFYDPKKKDNFSYSRYGVAYDRKICDRIRKRYNLKKEDFLNTEVLGIEVIRQVLSSLKDVSSYKTDLVLACSAESVEVVEWIYRKHYKDLLLKFPEKKEELESLFKKESSFLENNTHLKFYQLISAHLSEKLKNYFKFKGKHMLFDSACASFLSALYLAVERLKQKESDLVILTAGDQSLSPPGGAVLFSKLGALSQKTCLPFDYKTDGLCFGEAFIGFGLMRLSEARKRGLKILAVIGELSGSSDGNFSGITEPSFEGQTLAYKRTYGRVLEEKGKMISPSDIDYIETHGTGTVVGDKTELRSLTKFFQNRKIPIGSVKSVLGHTMPVAGAAGLLKCLCMIEKKEVFPSPYFDTFPKGVRTKLFLNKKPLSLKKEKPLHLALSSFGFGGCNYHMVLSEDKQEVQEKKTKALKLVSLEEARKERGKKEEEKIVLCSQIDLSLRDIKQCVLETDLKIPPKSFKYLDSMQIGALMAVEQTMKQGFSHMKKENVSVISSGHILLDSYYDFLHQIALLSQKRFLEKNKSDLKKEKDFSGPIEHLESKLSQFKEISQDTVHGMLTNIVAGRVCNLFNFQGVNFHVDHDFASQISALECAVFHLKKSKGGAFVLSFHEKAMTKRPVKRKGISCMFLATKEFALDNNLPILYEISKFHVDARKRGEEKKEKKQVG